jgi:membrane protease subunit HflK
VEDVLSRSGEKVLMDNPAAGRALPYLTLPGMGAPVAPKMLEKK